MDRPSSPLDLAPADALAYFQPPTSGQKNYTNVTPVLQLFGPDPQRVLILLGGSFSGANAFVGPTGTTGTGVGYTLNSTVPSAVFTYWDHGPIVTLGWEGSVQTSGGVTISWIVHSMSRWPDTYKSPAQHIQDMASQVKQYSQRQNGQQSVSAKLVAAFKRLTGRG